MARGKVYTTAPLLYNDQGDPIPQYLDVSDKTDSPQGSFKPLTNDPQDVRLTGSIVGNSSFSDIELGASESFRISRFTPRFKNIILAVRGDSRINPTRDISLRAGFYHEKGGSFFVFANEITDVVQGDSPLYAYFKVAVVTLEMIIDITNVTENDLILDRLSVIEVND